MANEGVPFKELSIFTGYIVKLMCTLVSCNLDKPLPLTLLNANAETEEV